MLKKSIYGVLSTTTTTLHKCVQYYVVHAGLYCTVVVINTNAAVL